MKGHQIPYSTDELQWLSDNRTMSMDRYHAEFQEKFFRNDVTKNNLNSLRKRMKWKTGRTGRFKQGHIPHNAGSAGTGLMKANKTSFKPGHTPRNTKKIGSTRVSKDGFIEVKIGENAGWRHLHVLIWTAFHGPVPESHCVSFIDGDQTNVKLDNLELINRNELLQINRLQCQKHRKELRPTIRAIGKLVAKTIENANYKASRQLLPKQK